MKLSKMIDKIRNSRYVEPTLVGALCAAFTLLGINSGLSVLDVSVYYMITMVLTLNWSMFCKSSYKYLVFGFCTFISVILSIVIFEVNPITITLMTLCAQAYVLMLTTITGNRK